jgi:DNA-directed RNA polymerase subunit RPC12/RpoP
MFIRSEQEVIAMNEAKINELKAETKCPACGSRISKGISFCPNCGAKIVPQQEAPAANEAADQVAASANQAAAPENTGAASASGAAANAGAAESMGAAAKNTGTETAEDKQ